MPNRIDFKKKLKEFNAFKRKVPKIAGNLALQHFLKAFDDEAFSDGSQSSDPWAKRKTKTKRDKKAGRRALLVQSGALKGSLSVRSATWKRIVVGSFGIKYAPYHNRGTKVLPKRQFIGRSKLLDRKIKKLISVELKKFL